VQELSGSFSEKEKRRTSSPALARSKLATSQALCRVTKRGQTRFCCWFFLVVAGRCGRAVVLTGSETNSTQLYLGLPPPAGEPNVPAVLAIRSTAWLRATAGPYVICAGRQFAPARVKPIDRGRAWRVGLGVHAGEWGALPHSSTHTMSTGSLPG
jgi:hypothetical protein